MPISPIATAPSAQNTNVRQNQIRAIRSQYSAINTATAGIAGIRYRAERWLGSMKTSASASSHNHMIFSASLVFSTVDRLAR